MKTDVKKGYSHESGRTFFHICQAFFEYIVSANMLILSRVCAQFRDAAGNVLFTISPENMLSFVEAPDAIR